MNYINPYKHIPTKEKHIDGEWWTTEYSYRDRKIQVKSREGKGMKAHVWNENSTEVIKTFRYRWIPYKLLLEKAKRYIDDIIQNENKD